MFKSVYFADYPDKGASRRSLTLAFGPGDASLHDALASLTSFELRAILGSESYSTLRDDAIDDALTVNAFCLRSLREWHQTPAAQLRLPGLTDGVTGTFRNARTAPLHRWYPFAEGYSPKFVSEVFDTFASGAKRVLDPFAGVGTTPLTLAGVGIEVVYCELNPLMQLLIEAKADALSLSTRERTNVSARLEELAANLSDELACHAPDRTLRASFVCAFGESKFFEEETFELILRSRAWIDRIACDDILVAKFASVAVATSLVACSLMRRAGDLRFRRGAELEDVRDIEEAIADKLRMIAADLREARPISARPRFVAENAGTLHRLPPLGLDAVITSPPYLNGTNYFRNTKIELWFLRSLTTPADLAAFRQAAITAGINDVTGEKPTSSHPSVQELVGRLGASAYDKRIPRMVGSYFHDMEGVLRAVTRHLKPDGVVAIDIGDSVYANTHVPTDELLVNVAEVLGLKLERSVHLRTRRSKDRSRLTQTLLVFRFTGAPHEIVKTRDVEPSWAPRWNALKAGLPHQKPPFASRSWGHGLHSLCSYQGKMKPALAHHLVKSFLSPGQTMLDPFGGVGTIPFEAALQGCTAYMFEISPAAAMIAAAKLGTPDLDSIEAVVSDLAAFIETESPTDLERAAASHVRFNGDLADYFHPKTFDEVLIARRFFKLHPPESVSERFVMASLLHILHGNRPYALSRRSHPITPFAPSGPAEYRELVPRLRKKIGRGLADPRGQQFTIGTVYERDATSWWPREIDSLDAIITSPPFFDSTRFHLGNWMRLWFAAWEREDFSNKPLAFVDERQKENFSVYEPVLRQSRERLKPGGVVVLHLGVSRKCDMAAEIERVASPWFRVVDRFVENVEHCESHGIRDKGTVTAHQYLVLQ